jgi:hypothetical protein
VNAASSQLLRDSTQPPDVQVLPRCPSAACGRRLRAPRLVRVGATISHSIAPLPHCCSAGVVNGERIPYRVSVPYRHIFAHRSNGPSSLSLFAVRRPPLAARCVFTPRQVRMDRSVEAWHTQQQERAGGAAAATADGGGRAGQ